MDGHFVGTQPDAEDAAARVLGGHLDTLPAGAARPAHRVDGGGDRQRQPAPPAGVDRAVSALATAGEWRAAGWCRSLDPRVPVSVVGVDVQVVDVDVDLDHFQAGHALDPLDHVLADGVGRLHDGLAVVTDDIDVDSRLAFPDLDRHPLGGGRRRAGTLERIDPNVRDMLLPRAWTPGISWVARWAILATTDDEIEVVPCSVLSAAPPELGLRSMVRDGPWPEDEPVGLENEADGVAVEAGGAVEVGEAVEPGIGVGVTDMVSSP